MCSTTRRIRSLVLTLALMCPVLIAAPPVAEVPFVSAQGDAGLMDGYFKYQTGEKTVGDFGVQGSLRNVASWSSKLKFPEDVLRVGASAALGWQAAPRWDWRLCGQIWKNLDDPGDKMVNEDILILQQSTGIYGKDDHRRVTAGSRGRIYSESDAELNAYGIDGKIEFIRRTGSGDVSIFLGHRYQKLDYDLYGLQGYQSGVSAFGMTDGPLVPVSGSTKVGAYEADTQIPYFGLGYYFDAFRRLHGALSVAYSPWAQVEDEDNHMSRAMASNSDADGSALMLKASARVDLLANVFARLTAEYTSLSVDGDTSSVFYRSTPEASAGMSFNGPISMDESQTAVYGSLGIEF